MSDKIKPLSEAEIAAIESDPNARRFGISTEVCLRAIATIRERDREIAELKRVHVEYHNDWP